jgi:predicted RNA-binding Zn-ribbon protein involved in translation (DUF1610 family)
MPDTIKYCSSCGQEVEGKVAKAAANPVVKYCPECGNKLTKDGTCGFRNCPYHGEIPPVG